jgi:MFS family permease
MQSSAANVVASLGAVVAGVILDQIGLAINFAICFFIAFLAALASWYCLALTREPSIPSPHAESHPSTFRNELLTILRGDKNFRWYLVSRMLYQVATMGFAFYTVYAVRYHNVGVVEVGVMTSVFMGAQIVANPVMGWIGDRTSHRLLLEAGAIAAVASALLAAWASSAGWFYLIFILAGIANVAAWTITITMTIDFAPDPSKRPVYVGLSNTLVAPAAILAPLFGGWLADTSGYSAAFVTSAIGGLIAWIVLRTLVRDPKQINSIDR